MLILTRGAREQIVIGDNLVVVTVLEVKGDRVRLGLEAAKTVHIARGELRPQQSDK